MDPDILLILGLLAGILAVPPLLGSLAVPRFPRLGFVLLCIAGGLVFWALQSAPGGYQIADIPEVFFGVLGRIFN